MIEAALGNHLQGITLQRFNRAGLGIGIPQSLMEVVVAGQVRPRA